MILIRSRSGLKTPFATRVPHRLVVLLPFFLTVPVIGIALVIHYWNLALPGV